MQGVVKVLLLSTQLSGSHRGTVKGTIVPLVVRKRDNLQ